MFAAQNESKARQQLIYFPSGQHRIRALRVFELVEMDVIFLVDVESIDTQIIPSVAYDSVDICAFHSPELREIPPNQKIPALGQVVRLREGFRLIFNLL